MTPHDDLNRRDFVKKSAFAASVAAILAKGISLGAAPTATATPTGTASGTRTACINDGLIILNNLKTDVLGRLENFNYDTATQQTLIEMFGNPPVSAAGIVPPFSSVGDMAEDFGEKMGKRMFNDLKDNILWNDYAQQALGRYSDTVLNFAKDKTTAQLGALGLLGFDIYEQNGAVVSLPSTFIHDYLQYHYPFSGSISGQSFTGSFDIGVTTLEFYINPDAISPRDPAHDWPRIGDFGFNIGIGIGFHCQL